MDVQLTLNSIKYLINVNLLGGNRTLCLYTRSNSEKVTQPLFVKLLLEINGVTSVAVHPEDIEVRIDASREPRELFSDIVSILDNSEIKIGLLDE